MGSELELQTIRANAQFANSMYKILTERRCDNIVFSPISAHAALCMLYQGASGDILKDFAKVLGLESSSKAAEGYELVMESLNNTQDASVSIANKVFIEECRRLKCAFKKIVEEKFRSEVETVDFRDPQKAAETINNWAKLKTLGKVEKLLSSDDLTNAQLALVNTVYFKAEWKADFHDLYTRTFHIDKEKTIDVLFTSARVSEPYKESVELDSKILIIRYKNVDFGMVIILPNRIDGIRDLELKLQSIDLSKITEGAEQRPVNIRLPAFKLEETLDLKNILTKMGLGGIFEKSSGFEGLVEPSDSLKVSKVLQKVFISVDNKGTEGAAATVMQANFYCGIKFKVPVMDFNADHPFVFMLTHKRNNVKNVLFYGRVMKPEFPHC